MLIRDYMTHRPLTLQIDSDYKAALKLMQDCAIHHLPVLDTEGKLAGIVAERDLLLAAYHYLGAAVDIGEVMHSDVVTATPDLPVADAALLMAGHSIGGLPVVDRSGRVVGIITETDVFRAFVETCQRDSTATRSTPAAKSGSRKSKAMGRSKKAAARPSSAKRGAKKRR
jgi:acetoin utilization protein AcuB